MNNIMIPLIAAIGVVASTTNAVGMWATAGYCEDDLITSNPWQASHIFPDAIEPEDWRATQIDGVGWTCFVDMTETPGTATCEHDVFGTNTLDDVEADKLDEGYRITLIGMNFVREYTDKCK